MRILVISNFYPPYILGGQEQSCRKVVEGLKLRGHQIAVLTSTYGVNQVYEDTNEVYRVLHMETDLVPWRQSINFFIKTRSSEKHNLKVLNDMIDDFEPDIVFVWGMWNMYWTIPVFVEAKCPGRVVYRFADYWPTLPSQRESYWRTPGRTGFNRLLKRFLGSIALATLRQSSSRLALQFERAIFVSAATRDTFKDAGILTSKSAVIHTGIDFQPYLNGSKDHRNGSSTLNLLYAGRLQPEKGVDTTVKALSDLVIQRGVKGVKLNIAGKDLSDYEGFLRMMVNEKGLEDYITFHGYVPNEEMPALLKKNDILLVPSLWPEPFARVLLEGMISGLVVIATACGGNAEIIEDEKNGLLFGPGEADALADKILMLKQSPFLRQNLAEAGKRTVMENFAFQTMMDKIEHFLLEVARSARSWDTLHYRRVGEEPVLEPL